MKFNIFQKKSAPMPAPTPRVQTEPQGEAEEYKVATFVPRKIPMTSELIRRQREEEILKKYCKPTIKTGVMM